MLVYYMSKSVFVVIVLSLCHYFLLFNILFYTINFLTYPLKSK